MNDYVWIDAKYSGKCAECREEIDEGDRVLWEPAGVLVDPNTGRESRVSSKVYCKDCGEDMGEVDSK